MEDMDYGVCFLCSK